MTSNFLANNIYVIYQVVKYKEFDVIQFFLKPTVSAKSRRFEQNLNYVKLIVFFNLNRLIFTQIILVSLCEFILRLKGFQIKCVNLILKCKGK